MKSLNRFGLRSYTLTNSLAVSNLFGLFEYSTSLNKFHSFSTRTLFIEVFKILKIYVDHF